MRPRGHARAAAALASAALLAAGAVGLAAGQSTDRIVRQVGSRSGSSIMRVELRLQPDARTRPQLVLMTLGGPIYCGQLFNLAAHERASVVCTDYGRNGYEGPGGRAAR